MLHAAIVLFGLLATLPGDPPTSADRDVYKAAVAKSGRDAGAHVRLASWCERHGLNLERHKHLAIALDIDPDNATAHGLLGQMAHSRAWRTPISVVAENRDDAATESILALYQARRAKIPDTAQAHWQLAEWCEENGLKAQAAVHLAAVVRLNPAKEEARKKLGYRQQKGRWILADQATAERSEAEAQNRADAKWRASYTSRASG